MIFTVVLVIRPPIVAIGSSIVVVVIVVPGTVVVVTVSVVVVPLSLLFLLGLSNQEFLQLLHVILQRRELIVVGLSFLEVNSFNSTFSSLVGILLHVQGLLLNEVPSIINRHVHEGTGGEGWRLNWVLPSSPLKYISNNSIFGIP